MPNNNPKKRTRSDNGLVRRFSTDWVDYLSLVFCVLWAVLLDKRGFFGGGAHGGSLWGVTKVVIVLLVVWILVKITNFLKDRHWVVLVLGIAVGFAACALIFLGVVAKQFGHGSPWLTTLFLAALIISAVFNVRNRKSDTGTTMTSGRRWMPKVSFGRPDNDSGSQQNAETNGTDRSVNGHRSYGARDRKPV